jgi:hypothetical protein
MIVAFRANEGLLSQMLATAVAVAPTGINEIRRTPTAYSGTVYFAI